MTARHHKPSAPVFLNLSAIRFPIGAIASIAHRLSGVLLLAMLPLLARTLDQSLRSSQDYEALLGPSRPLWLSGLLVVITWAATHHLLAGIRHLLLDIGIGSRLPAARASAWTALLGALLVAAFAAWGLA